jgi:hypothetical protein
MNDELTKICLHDYSDVKELSDTGLKMLISDIIDIEEVPNALYELYDRNKSSAMVLAENILNNNLGDEYLQGAVIGFVFDIDKQYVVSFVENNLAELNSYVFGCILDCFSVESMQPFGQSLTRGFLKNLFQRYQRYSDEEQARISDKFDWFKSSYKEMLI